MLDQERDESYHGFGRNCRKFDKPGDFYAYVRKGPWWLVAKLAKVSYTKKEAAQELFETWQTAPIRGVWPAVHLLNTEFTGNGGHSYYTVVACWDPAQINPNIDELRAAAAQLPINEIRYYSKNVPYCLDAPVPTKGEIKYPEPNLDTVFHEHFGVFAEAIITEKPSPQFSAAIVAASADYSIVRRLYAPPSDRR